MYTIELYTYLRYQYDLGPIKYTLLSYLYVR